MVYVFLVSNGSCWMRSAVYDLRLRRAARNVFRDVDFSRRFTQIPSQIYADFVKICVNLREIRATVRSTNRKS